MNQIRGQCRKLISRNWRLEDSVTVDPHKMKLSDLRKLAFPEPQEEKPPAWEQAWNDFRQSCPDYRETPNES